MYSQPLLVVARRRIREPKNFVLATGFEPPVGGERKGTKNGLDRGNRFVGDASFITHYVGECREALKLYFELQRSTPD